MNASEVLQLIRNGENSRVALKRDNLLAYMLARDIVALANETGGHIIMGVQDDRSITGVEVPGLEDWLVNMVYAQYVYPEVPLVFDLVEVEAGKHVAVLTVSEGLAKPYVVRNGGLESIYVRTGSVCTLATREQSERLFACGSLVRSEQRPVLGTTLNDLDMARLVDYLKNFVGDTVLPSDADAWVDRLCNLGFMVDHAGACTTIAGLVLFGREPGKFLRQAGIRWTGAAADVLQGPLVSLGTGHLGLIDILKERIRLECADYPFDAVLEAILNAFAHRDWSRHETVEMVLHNDRVEVMSPGSLPESMTIEAVLGGQRSARNSIIVDVLRDYGYVKVPGMGVRRTIVPLTREFCGRDPILEATEAQFKVTIPSKSFES